MATAEYDEKVGRKLAFWETRHPGCEGQIRDRVSDLAREGDVAAIGPPVAIVSGVRAHYMHFSEGWRGPFLVTLYIEIGGDCFLVSDAVLTETFGEEEDEG